MQHGVACLQLREARRFLGRQRTARRQGVRDTARHAVGGDLEQALDVAVEPVHIATSGIRALDQNRIPVDPERLELQEVSVEQLGRGRQREVHHRITRDDPRLVVGVHREVEVRRCVLCAGRDVVHNKAKVHRIGLERHVEVHAVAVRPRHVDGPARVVALVGGCVVEGIHRPAGVVPIGPVEVNPGRVGRYVRVVMRHRNNRLCVRQSLYTRQLPELIALRRRVDVLVCRHILGVAHVDNDAHVGRPGRDPDVEVGAEAVGAANLDGAPVVVSLILGRVTERVNRPSRIGSVRPVVVNANMVHRNGRLGPSRPASRKNRNNHQQPHSAHTTHTDSRTTKVKGRNAPPCTTFE